MQHNNCFVIYILYDSKFLLLWCMILSLLYVVFIPLLYVILLLLFRVVVAVLSIRHVVC